MNKALVVRCLNYQSEFSAHLSQATGEEAVDSCLDFFKCSHDKKSLSLASLLFIAVHPSKSKKNNIFL